MKEETLTVKISSDLLKKLKIACIEKEKKFKDLIYIALQEYYETKCK